MTVLAIFGITDGTLNLVANLVILALVVIWLALVWRTYADARRRLVDPMLIWCATIAAFIFPYIGAAVWAIVRPPEYIDDAHERELEIQAAETRLAQLNDHVCQCGELVEKDWMRCPHCTRRLKAPCPNCEKPVQPGWRACPYCEHELSTPKRRSTRQPRRRKGSDEEPTGETRAAKPARKRREVVIETDNEPATEAPAPRERRSSRSAEASASETA